MHPAISPWCLTLPAAIALAACTTAPGTPASSTIGVAMPAANAQATTGPAPGQWQLVLEVDDQRGAGKVPAQTMSLCSTPEDKRQWQDMVGGKSAAGCAVK